MHALKHLQYNTQYTRLVHIYVQNIEWNSGNLYLYDIPVDKWLDKKQTINREGNAATTYDIRFFLLTAIPSFPVHILIQGHWQPDRLCADLTSQNQFP